MTTKKEEEEVAVTSKDEADGTVLPHREAKATKQKLPSLKESGVVANAESY
jgi:hypothetical protein